MKPVYPMLITKQLSGEMIKSSKLLIIESRNLVVQTKKVVAASKKSIAEIRRWYAKNK
jgi:hypothetical protein